MALPTWLMKLLPKHTPRPSTTLNAIIIIIIIYQSRPLESFSWKNKFQTILSLVHCSRGNIFSLWCSVLFDPPPGANPFWESGQAEMKRSLNSLHTRTSPTFFYSLACSTDNSFSTAILLLLKSPPTGFSQYYLRVSWTSQDAFLGDIFTGQFDQNYIKIPRARSAERERERERGTSAMFIADDGFCA